MRQRCTSGLGVMVGWAVLAGGLAPAQAQVATWLGSSDTNWATAANWQGGVIPGVGGTNSVCITVNNGANNPLYYTAAQGDSIFTNGTGTGSNRPLRIGDFATGELRITGGTLTTIGSAADLVGNGASGNATLVIDGGRYIATNGGVFMGVTAGGSATVTMSGGTGIVSTIEGANATGTLNLNGGLLALGRFYISGAMPATVNFNGGILRSLSTQTDWLPPTNTTYNIQAGGANFSVTNTVGIRGVLAGVGGVTKNNTSTLTLSGSNTYAGVTTINDGYLVVGHNMALGSTNGGTVVKAGATLRLNNGMAVTGETATISGTGGDNYGAIQAAGSSTSTWAGAIVINDNGGTAAPRIGAQSTGVLTVSGPISNGGGNNLYFAGAGATGRVILSGTNNTYTGLSGIIRGVLQLGANDALPVGTTLDLNVAKINNDASTFDLAGFNQTVAQLTSALSTNTQPMLITNRVGATTSVLTVNQSANSTYNGQIAGNVSLVKSGTGTLTLSNATAHTGATILNAGALHIAPSNGLGGSAVTINGGTLLLGTTNAVPGTITFTPGNNAAAIGPSYALDQAFVDWVPGKASGTVPVVAMGANSANAVTFGGTLAGTFLGGAGATSVTNTGGAVWGDTTVRLGGGSGTLVYQAAIPTNASVLIGPVGGNPNSTVALPTGQTFTNPITINSGSLRIAGDTSLGALPAATTPGSVVINGGTLLAPSGDLNIDSKRGFAIGTNGAVFSPGVVLRVHGAVADLAGQSGVLYAANTGVLVLDGANTYSGGTVILPGSQVAIQGNQALGVGTVIMTGGTLRATSTTPTTPNVSNAVVIAADSAIGGNNGKALIFLGAITLAGTGSTRTLTMAGTDSATFAGPVGDGGLGYGLIKTGSSTLTMYGAGSTYSGGTTVSGGAIALGASNPLGSGLVTLNGGTLRASGAARTLTNNVQVNAVAGNVLDASGGDLNLYGNLAGAGAVTKSGGSALQLWGNNSGFGGTLSNNSGFIWINNAASGSAAARWELGVSNVIAANTDNAGVGIQVHLGALSGASSSVVRAGGFQTGTVTFAIGALGLDTEFAGSFQDSPNLFATGAVVKVGSGTLTLTGASAHKGGMIVSNGTLAVNGSMAGLITVVPGATLRGTGTLGSLTMDAGSVFAPGNSIGTNTVTGALTLSGNINVFELASATDHDQTVVGAGGSLTLANKPLLQLELAGFSANTNDTIVLFENQFAAGITLTDTFWLDGATQLADNSVFNPDGGAYTFRIDYDAGAGGNDIMLTVVPEPGTFGLFALIGLAALARRRRR